MPASAHKPELLAPAGDWDCIKAAVANGADAIYFGLTTFNARHRAHNFEPNELPKLMNYLHERGVKGYVTFNILIFSDEFEAALELLERIQLAKTDAVIVQDVGLAWALKQLMPALHVHASTQMSLTDSLGISLVKSLDIQRVILARELSIAEISKVHHASDIPIEVFVHGALCVAYSGQCLTSETLGGRSANRGQCAQACRMPYDLYVDGKHRELNAKSYLLSPQDLAAYDLVQSLAQHGVVSLKIEGRLKQPEYVAATVQAYRKAIDSIVQEDKSNTATTIQDVLTRQEVLELEQTFSRGLSHGFLTGINHQTLVPGRSPKKRGVRIGNVLGTTSHGVVVQLSDASIPPDWLVKPGDGVVFDEGKPEENETGGRVWKILNPHARRSDLVELQFDRESVNISHIAAGTIVWKTDDPALRKKLEKSLARDKPIERNRVHAHLEGRLNSYVKLTLTTDDVESASATWPGPLTLAQKHPTARPVVFDQLSRLGDTPYKLEGLKLDLPDNVMLPKSVLNELRRQAVVQLLLNREMKNKPHQISVIPMKKRLVEWRQQLFNSFQPLQTHPDAQLCLLIRSLEQLSMVVEYISSHPDHKPAIVYCDFEDIRKYRDAIQQARIADIRIGVATLRVIKPGEESWLRLIASYQPDVILARNLSSIAYFKRYAAHIPIIGDFSLNIVNDVTAHWYLKHQLQRITPGYDLNWVQMQSLLQRVRPEWFEVVVHYHMPMFHNEHCVFAALLSQGKDWRDCGRPCDRHRVELKDHLGARFPVMADAGCRNTVYHDVPQSAAEYIPSMIKLGVRQFRIELLHETHEQLETLLETYFNILHGREDGKHAWQKLKATQQLGVTRGTLQLV